MASIVQDKLHMIRYKNKKKKLLDSLHMRSLDTNSQIPAFVVGSNVTAIHHLVQATADPKKRVKSKKANFRQSANCLLITSVSIRLLQ